MEVFMNGFKFAGKDIGNPRIPGSMLNISEGISITAGGADIWGTKDQFHFVYKKHTGDFDFIARVEALSRADLYSKAGIMARETLESTSKHAYIMVFPDNSLRNNNNGGFEFQYRELEAGESKAIYPSSGNISNPPVFPVNFPNTWIRLKRTENNFVSFFSTSGKDWKIYASYTLNISANVYLGLAVTSHNVDSTITAKFVDISVI
jgi:regulation of enolase protein 1 (concanavalin A-like superfamily)